MEYLYVIAAGVVAWIFGAIWYMVFAKQWQQAAGIKTGKGAAKKSSVVSYIVSLIGAILVAGMMRHVIETSYIYKIEEALVTGLGLGLFVVSPWIVNNILFAQRDRRLIWIDCAYPIIGMGIMGVILVLPNHL